MHKKTLFFQKIYDLTRFPVIPWGCRSCEIVKGSSMSRMNMQLLDVIFQQLAGSFTLLVYEMVRSPENLMGNGQLP